MVYMSEEEYRLKIKKIEESSRTIEWAKKASIISGIATGLAGLLTIIFLINTNGDQDIRPMISYGATIVGLVVWPEIVDTKHRNEAFIEYEKKHLENIEVSSNMDQDEKLDNQKVKRIDK